MRIIPLAQSPYAIRCRSASDAEIHTADIGAVIGAHVGPGMLALIYWGTTR